MENDSSMTLTKEDRKYMKMADDRVLRLLIPKPGSKSYMKIARVFDRIDGNEKYKNLTIFFVKRAYFTFLTIVAVIVVNCIPLFIYLLQQWMGIENSAIGCFAKRIHYYFVNCASNHVFVSKFRDSRALKREILHYKRKLSLLELCSYYA